MYTPTRITHWFVKVNSYKIISLYIIPTLSEEKGCLSTSPKRKSYNFYNLPFSSPLYYQCSYLNKSHINTPVVSSNFLTNFKLFCNHSTVSMLKSWHGLSNPKFHLSFHLLLRVIHITDSQNMENILFLQHFPFPHDNWVFCFL